MTLRRRTEAEEVIDPERPKLLNLSKVILEAICFHDKTVLDALLASDFIFIGESGRLDRDGFLESVGAGDFVAVAHGFESIEIEIFGMTAAAAGIQRVEVELPGGVRAVSRQCFTDIFVKSDTGWRVRLAHSVELP